MKSLGNVFIIGDSYSTFEGYVPEGYFLWYSNTPKPETDVTKVSETWWWQLIEETGSNLVLNNSWSGSTICNTCREGYNIKSSFISRFDELANNGFLDKNQIDTVFVFGATNDSCIDSPIGELMFEGWNEENLLSVLPAVCYLFNRIKTVIPNAKITNIANTDLKEIITDGMKKAAEHFGVKHLQLENLSKQYGHPDIKGMIQIKEQIINYLYN